MHKPLFLITAGSVAAVGALVVASAMPAGAATSVRAETMARIQPAPGPDPSAYTSVTFTITTTGNLAISAPTTLQHLDGDSTTNAGGTIGAAGISNFGAVTVTDGRDDAASTWTATVASTDFTTPGTAGNVIPVDDAT